MCARGVYGGLANFNRVHLTRRTDELCAYLGALYRTMPAAHLYDLLVSLRWIGAIMGFMWNALVELSCNMCHETNTGV